VPVSDADEEAIMTDPLQHDPTKPEPRSDTACSFASSAAAPGSDSCNAGTSTAGSYR
jgi:hypothetical protein